MDVRPLDPLSCPSQDRIQVTLKNEEEKLVPGWMKGVECQVSERARTARLNRSKRQSLQDLFPSSPPQVDYDPRQHVLRVTGDLNESGYADFPSLESIPIFLEVFIPIKYDVDIVTRHHGRVSVKACFIMFAFFFSLSLPPFFLFFSFLPLFPYSSLLFSLFFLFPPSLFLIPIFPSPIFSRVWNAT